jgi:cytoskeletal protein RodZ
LLLGSRYVGSTLYSINNFIHFIMPYIIAVLALVILGTGYTLFQNNDTPLAENQEIPSSIPVTNEVQPVTTDSFDDSDGRIDDDEEDNDENEEDYDDNPSASDTPKSTAPPTTNEPAPRPANPTPAPIVDNNTYSNGTYYATKSYRTPDGTYQMNVSVTVKNDAVTGSTLSFDANGSRDGYSKRFSSGYQNQVIGQDLGGLSLSRVGGASLTTKAFNSALDTIRSQAS